MSTLHGFHPLHLGPVNPVNDSRLVFPGEIPRSFQRALCECLPLVFIPRQLLDGPRQSVDHVTRRGHRDFDPAGFVHYFGKAAVIQADNGQPEGQRLHRHGRGQVAQAGDQHPMRALHDFQRLFSGHPAVKAATPADR